MGYRLISPAHSNNPMTTGLMRTLYAVAIAVAFVLVILVALCSSDSPEAAIGEQSCDGVTMFHPQDRGQGIGTMSEPGQPHGPRGPGDDRRVVMVPGMYDNDMDRILEMEHMNAERQRMESEGMDVVFFDDGRHDPVSDAIRECLGEGIFTDRVVDSDTVMDPGSISADTRDDSFLLDVADALEEKDHGLAEMVRHIVDYRQTVSSEVALRQMSYVWKYDQDQDSDDPEMESVDEDENDLPVPEADSGNEPYDDTAADVPCLMHVYRYSGGAVDGPVL